MHYCPILILINYTSIRPSEKPLFYHFNELSNYTQKPYLFSFDTKQ